MASHCKRYRREIMVLNLGTIFLIGLIYAYTGIDTEEHRQKQCEGNMGPSSNKVEQFLAWNSVQLQRRKRVQQLCSTMDEDALSTTNSTKHRTTFLDADAHPYAPEMYVNSHHRLVFCQVDDAINVSRILDLVALHDEETYSQEEGGQHRGNSFQRYQVDRLTRFLEEDTPFVLETYAKFLFVMHPFERLVFIYNNFLGEFMDEQVEEVDDLVAHLREEDLLARRTLVAKHIMSVYRTTNPSSSMRINHEATFKDFIYYILKEPKNEIWAPVTKLCHPCDIRYDYIGRLETLPKDLDFLLKQLFGVQSSHLTDVGSSDNCWGHDFGYHAYFKVIPPEMIQQLSSMYQLDFELFGYHNDLI